MKKNLDKLDYKAGNKVKTKHTAQPLGYGWDLTDPADPKPIKP